MFPGQAAFSIIEKSILLLLNKIDLLLKAECVLGMLNVMV